MTVLLLLSLNIHVGYAGWLAVARVTNYSPAIEWWERKQLMYNMEITVMMFLCSLPQMYMAVADCIAF